MISVYLLGASSLSYANPVGDATKGKASYVTCVACHGAAGEGKKILNAPAIAGQGDWYLTRQLKNFKAGIRGAHPKDIYGAQMRPMSMTLADDAAIANVVAYIKTFPNPPAEKLSELPGDATVGKTLYMTCSACHGPNAEGKKMLNGPRLNHLPSWYIMRQLKNFKAGIRGAHPKDVYGAQMRPMSMTLVDDTAVQNVTRYIKSLAQK